MSTLRRFTSLLAAEAFACGAAIAAAAEEPALRSAAALVMDADTGEILHAKNAAVVAPIASITKIMTAMVTLDADLPLDERITITADDAEAGQARRVARLAVGASLTRQILLGKLITPGGERPREERGTGQYYQQGTVCFLHVFLHAFCI